MTKFQRKVVAFLITITMVLSMVSMAFAVDNSTVYQQSANTLKEYGVFVGDSQGNLMLDQTLKRQDAVIISLRLMGISDEEFTSYENPSDFTDITNPYYLPVIGMAQDMGLVEGMGNGTFGFNQLITAQQLETLLLRALGYEITSEIYPTVDQLASQVGIMSQISIEKTANITRDMVAQMMLNTLNTNVKDETQKLGEQLGFFEQEPEEQKVAPVLSDVAASAASTTEATVTISGKVTPATATVTVGGAAATVTEGAFSAVANLVDGANNIQVVATNDGLTDTKSVEVTKTVAPVAAPIVVKANNATGEAVELNGAINMVSDKDSLITMTFPSTVNKDTVTRTYIKLYEGTGLVSLAAPTVKSDNKTVTIGPSDNLKDNTQYKLVIMPGIKNADGTEAVTANQEYVFTTGAANYLTGVADAHPRTLSEITTTNIDADDAQYADAITFTFKRDLDPSSISASSVKLYDITGGTNTLIPVVNKLGANNNKLQTDISATDGLTSGHQYKLVLGSLKDLVGVNVAMTEINFTVAANYVAATPKEADRSTALTGNSLIWPKLTAGSLDGTTAIKYGAKIYVSFDQAQAMDANTINNNTLYLEKLDASGNVVEKVTATVEYDSTFRMASITPATDLASDNQYKLTIKKGANGIKDILGLKLDNSDTDQTVTFNTLDVEAPAVQSIALKTASGNDVTATSGMNDVDSSKQLRFAINFNEEIASVDNTTYAAANYDTDLTNNIETAQKYFEAGKSIVVINTTDDVVMANSANLTASLSSDNKILYVTMPANTLEKAHSYAIKLAGKSSNPNSSATTAHAISDRTNYTGGNDNLGVNRMAEMYQFTFSTIDNDSVAPTVTGILIGSSYDTATALAAGTKNVDEGKNLYITFSEKMTSAASKTSIDNAGNQTLASKNIQLQARPVSGSWAAAALENSDNNNAVGAGFIGFTDDNTKDISYLTILAADIAADTNYKLVITPGALANGLEDLSANDIAADWNLEFTTNGGIVFSPVAAGTAMTTKSDVLTAAIAAGDGAGAAEVACANLTSTDGDYVGIETVDGSMVFAVTDAGGPAQPTSLATDLTAAADIGAMIVNMTTSSASFANMDSNYVVSNPIAIRIDGVATDKVDLNTITSATVKLVKVSDSSEVTATLSAVRGADGDALIAINPSTNLEYNTQYKVVVEGVKDELGNTIVTKESFFTTEKASPAKLAISAVSPSNGAINVAVNGAITVTFNEDVTAGSGPIANATGPAAITKGTTTAVGVNALDTGTPGDAECTVALHNVTDSEYLTGRISVSADGKTITIIPDALLEANKVYNIELGGALTSNNLSGADTTLLAQNATRVFSFRTEDAASVKPQLVSARWINANTPGTESVTAGDLVVLTFNTGIDVASITAANLDSEFSLDLGGTFDAANNDSTIALSSDKTTLTITLGTAPVLVPNATKINAAQGAITSVNGAAVDTNQVTIIK